MAVCILNRDILKSDTCGYSLKTIVELYLANFSDVTGSTLTQSEGGKGTEVGTITMKGEAKFYKVEALDESASFSDELVVGNNGTKYRTATISASLGGTYDGLMNETLDALSLGKYIAVARLSDGAWVMLGRLSGLSASVANLNGSATADGEQGITFTLTGNTTESALPLSEAAISTVTGA